MSVLSIQTRRIDGLTEATTAEDEDLLLIRKADGTGTRNIKKKNLIPKVVDKVGDLKELITADKTSVVKAMNETKNLLDGISSDLSNRIYQSEFRLDDLTRSEAGNHNALYRGLNLGKSISDKQIESIRSGSFYNLYVGDFWQIGLDFYYIAHLDYFPTGDHHAVLVPGMTYGNEAYGKIASSSDDYVGYYYSNIHHYIESTCALAIKDGIKKYFKNVDIKVSSQITPAHGSYRDRIMSTTTRTYISSLTQEMVFGYPARWMGDDDQEFNNGQLAIFQYNKRFVNQGCYWLGDLHGPNVGVECYFGRPRYKHVTQNSGVRPIIVIG